MYFYKNFKAQTILFLINALIFACGWKFMPPYVGEDELFSARMFIISSLVSLLLIQSLVIGKIGGKSKVSKKEMMPSIFHGVLNFVLMYIALLYEISMDDPTRRLDLYHTYMWKILTLSVSYFVILVFTTWMCLVSKSGNRKIRQPTLNWQKISLEDMWEYLWLNYDNWEYYQAKKDK
jgi:hypothetical protein